VQSNRPDFRRLFFALLVICGGPVLVPGQEDAPDRPIAPTVENPAASQPPIRHDQHPWARFPIGSWKQVRIVEQTLDADGRVTSESIMLRVERLHDVNPEHYSLSQEITIEVGGRQVEAPPKTVTLGLWTHEPGAVESVSEAPPEPISADGREIESHVLNVVTGGEAHTVTTRLWYAPDKSPYLLRSVSEAVLPSSQETVWLRSRKILATALPFVLRTEQVAASFYEEQLTSAKSSRQSILVWVDQVPGGLAKRWTKETDAEGQLVRREVESLLDWGIDGRSAADAPRPPDPATR
jgi:hypothetical protein